MPAPVIEFKSAVVARRVGGGLALALFDGALDQDGLPACVAILLCAEPSALTLVEAVGSALRTPKPD
jgi:hypothetical protein